MKYKAGILLYRTSAEQIEVLIVRNGKGNWSIPKGNIEEGESHLRAAKRELLEEVAILAPVLSHTLVAFTMKSVTRFSAAMSDEFRNILNRVLKTGSPRQDSCR
ncbi:MAG: NUDIX domain-containing protein [Microbacterium sp.]|nr:MAG: NUDIX domain-containing protein [Microbacterium sp.]